MFSATVWDISVHGHDMFSATVWDISVHGHDMFGTTVWDISVHGHDNAVLQYVTFQYMDMTCSVPQSGIQYCLHVNVNVYNMGSHIVYIYIFFLFFHWHYTLAYRNISFHFFLPATNSLRPLTPST